MATKPDIDWWAVTSVFWRRRRRGQCQTAYPPGSFCCLLVPSGLRQDHALLMIAATRKSTDGRHHSRQREHHPRTSPICRRPTSGTAMIFPELTAVSASRLHRQCGLQPAHSRPSAGHPPRTARSTLKRVQRVFCPAVWPAARSPERPAAARWRPGARPCHRPAFPACSTRPLSARESLSCAFRIARN